MEPHSLVRQVRRKVNNNDHGGAYLIIAEALGDDDLVQAFTLINQAHLKAGNLPFELYEARHLLYLQLMHQARKHLKEENFRQIHSAL